MDETKDLPKKVTLTQDQLWSFRYAILERKLCAEKLKTQETQLKVHEKEVRIAELIVELQLNKVGAAKQAINASDIKYQDLKNKLSNELGISLENVGINELTGEVTDLKEL